MKHIYFVMGVSGSGKSTICQELEKVYKDRDDFMVSEFDADGVPADFTTLRQWIDWRVERTENLIKNILWDNEGGVICGTVLPYEFWRFNHPLFNEKEVQFHFCMLTCSEVSIRQRLRQRDWGIDLIHDNVTLDAHLKWEMMREFEGIIVDTNFSIPETTSEVSKWIDKNDSGTES